MKRITKLYSARSRGPNRRGHVSIENLSCYRQNAEIIGTCKGRDVLDNEEIAFDIERRLSSSKKFLYSLMIDTCYPLKEGPSAKEYENVMSSIDGFVLDNKHSDKTYYNNQKNVFVNRSTHTLKGIIFSKDIVCIGVIQETPIENLFEVINMIPYFVAINNQLNPSRTLNQDIVDKSIVLALEQDKYLYGKLR